MGQARIKKRAHAALLDAYPWCVYCGNRATTVEHMPPIAMFRDRQRPSGLEFPCCKPCNHSTRHSDLVASLLGRVYPDAPDENGTKELHNLLRAVRNNVPGLLEEMRVSRAGQKLALRDIAIQGAGVLRAGGPLVSKHMTIFAAKLGFALHFDLFKTPVPPAGGVLPMWFSNVQAMRGELPKELIALLPAPRTLRQGRREVSDQFLYSQAIIEEQQHAFFYIVFRVSFAVVVATAVNRSVFLMKHAEARPVFKPGDFRG